MQHTKPAAGERMRDAAVGAFVTIAKIAPQGALQARKVSSGAIFFYWRFTHKGKTDRVHIGPYGSTLPPKINEPRGGMYSVLAATRAAESLAARHLSQLAGGGHRAIVQSEREERLAVAAAKIEADKHTLRALLEAYVRRLEALGRSSFKDARSIFQLHVFEAWPSFSDRPAALMTDEDAADMFRRLNDLGKERTANKLRAYMHAAYAMARSARSNPKTPAEFKVFNVRHNPISDTAANSAANRADKKPLAADELRLYWRSVASAPGFEAAVLRLHLLTGAQRIAQFVRLKKLDTHAESIMLLDGKGRPGAAPREHHVPLVDAAARSLKTLMTTPYTRTVERARTHSRRKPKQDDRPSVYTISTTQGRDHLAPKTLSDWAREAAMQVGIEQFSAKRLRSGVETILAAAKVDQETRGRLQSHGIGGVQAKHYDGHDYLAEKLEALQTLYDLLMVEPTRALNPEARFGASN